MKSNPDFKRILILHDIRSAQNVGSLLRTSDAAGIHLVYLSGITPSPLDRFGRPNTLVTKASLGAEEFVEWKSVKTIGGVITKLNKEGFQIIAIEQSKDAKDYKKIKVGEKVAFILGNEVDGLPPRILKSVTDIAEIPMKGRKESLNVSVAGGIAIFRMLNI